MRGLRLASFNIQTGIHTRQYHDYLFKSWQHLWPTDKRFVHLDRIANFLKEFDIVGLQEVDGGGARSHYVVQTEFLAHQAGFPHWYNQINRKIGRLALHSNGLLSRLRPCEVTSIPLPGLPGRGAVLARFGQGKAALHLVILHLALGARTRSRQLNFIADWLTHLPHVVVMGDLNCSTKSKELHQFLNRTGLVDPQPHLRTFPSWRPRRKLDHILVSPAVKVSQVEVFDFVCSDHLPIGAEISVPAGILQQAA